MIWTFEFRRIKLRQHSLQMNRVERLWPEALCSTNRLVCLNISPSTILKKCLKCLLLGRLDQLSTLSVNNRLSSNHRPNRSLLNSISNSLFQYKLCNSPRLRLVKSHESREPLDQISRERKTGRIRVQIEREEKGSRLPLSQQREVGLPQQGPSRCSIDSRITQGSL